MLVVEHDEETMRSSDFIIDIGWGAGEEGGNIVATGDCESYQENRLFHIPKIEEKVTMKKLLYEEQKKIT